MRAPILDPSQVKGFRNGLIIDFQRHLRALHPTLQGGACTRRCAETTSTRGTPVFCHEGRVHRIHDAPRSWDGRGPSIANAYSDFLSKRTLQPKSMRSPSVEKSISWKDRQSKINTTSSWKFFEYTTNWIGREIVAPNRKFYPNQTRKIGTIPPRRSKNRLRNVHSNKSRYRTTTNQWSGFL